jgi:hypothetical protein
MNICDNDDDDDDIMEFLIHDEDDNFTEALIIVSNILEEESDDDEPLVPPYVWGSGSGVEKAPNIERRRVFYSHLLFGDFWGSAPIYNPTYFKKFFKIPIRLFDDIVPKVTANDDYFQQKKDAVGKMGLSSLQKICSAVCQLTSGVSSAEHDDKYCMAASTGLEAMKRFCHSIMTVYGDKVLCHPNAVAIGRLLDEGCAAGFPGCVGSIDCMYWEWKNCPSG